MTAPKEILQLVERFREQREAYLNPHYNEAQLRKEFLDPFFEALGWDVDNKQGYAEPYKHVVHEASVKVGIETKAPDYSFRIGGTRKFFVEAKKPSVKIHDDPEPAFQLRRYAWSAKLPLSILSNFAEFAVYDCRVKPLQSDKAAKSRTLYLTADDFAERWDEIAGIFSYEAINKGSFDKYAVGKGKKGTAEVDSAFLEEIEFWRETLAKNIALRNADLTPRELNFAVQQTIDRIIFLRICEDRGIESYGRLRGLLNGSNVYPRLRQLFHDADDRYNSGLFHFRRETGRGEPDSLTLGLEIDDKVLKEILKNLYYPDSPYEFSVLPADILGQVYEQFLGKVIRLTSGGHAKVEDKPEVKKAGGVYYTPTYIVDYIVKSTVGKLVEGKKPQEVEKLRILDPACGSGSFLIGAYQYLLDWYLRWYSENEPEKHAKGRSPKIFKAQGNVWRLTTAERKRILLSNIYGVDIDPQAVEVTKLSLLLKVLEEESAETLGRNWEMFHERALPDLDGNIKCGNSLIGPDFYEERLDLDEDEKYRVNAFDWQAEFQEVFKAGGFDAVIGNPPYGAQFHSEEKNYFFRKYTVLKGQPESYEYFIYQSRNLCKEKGYLSFIVPTNFTESERAEGLRKVLLEKGHVHLVSNFRYNVWQKNAAETLVFVYQNSVQTKYVRVVHPASPIEFSDDAKYVNIEQAIWWRTPGKRFLMRADPGLIIKIEKNAICLQEICDLSQGIIVYKTRQESAKNPYISEGKRGSEWKKLMDTESSIQRYLLSWGKRYLKYGDWLWCPRDPKYFELPKILFVRLRNKALSRKLVATYDEDKFYNRDNFNNIILKDDRYSLKYVLGLFNSALLNYWYKAYFDNVNINPAQVRLMPVCSINFNERVDRARHDKMVKLVEKVLSFHKQLAKAKTAHEKDVLQRQIDATDKQIDHLVYELYGLAEEEIRIVEGNA